MMCSEEPVHFDFPPVLEDILNSNEIHELLSSYQIEFPSHSTSSSETNRPVYSIEERKHRRKISNRESAKRSRWRKKRQLEDLTQEVNRMRLENWELKNRLCMVTREHEALQRETGPLLTESVFLRRKLAGLREILSAMQLP